MNSQNKPAGRLIKAPESFLDAAGVRQVFVEAKRDRRDFIRSAFAAASAATAAPIALAAGNPVPPTGGDVNILELPAHSKGLGQPVATDGPYAEAQDVIGGTFVLRASDDAQAQMLAASCPPM